MARLRFRVSLSAVVLVLAGCSNLRATDISPCDREQIGEEDGPLIGAYEVINGELGTLCFGTADHRLAESWKTLTDIASPADLAPVVVFAGYRSDGSDSGNIAFAGPLGESNESFVVAVDLDEASNDLDELRVTMAHEFAHIFTQVTAQVDAGSSRTSCDTFWNGSWCFAPNSYMAEWVEQFWSDDAIRQLPVSGEPDSDGGDERCTLDPSFLGSYAASHPEEDFAESFAAFVYNIDVPNGVAAKQGFFDRYPELMAYRDRAQQAGESDLPNNFDRCG